MPAFSGGPLREMKFPKRWRVPILCITGEHLTQPKCLQVWHELRKENREGKGIKISKYLGWSHY